MKRVTAILLAGALALTLGGCTPADEPDDAPSVPEDPTAGLRLAPGIYDLEDGSVQAVGVLEWIDLEGGFWAVTDGTGSDESPSANIAIIANGADLQDTLSSLEGSSVSVTGERFDGASIRMAGPEIIAETVEELSDTPGIAE